MIKGCFFTASCFVLVIENHVKVLAMVYEYISRWRRLKSSHFLCIIHKLHYATPLCKDFGWSRNVIACPCSRGLFSQPLSFSLFHIKWFLLMLIFGVYLVLLRGLDRYNESIFLFLCLSGYINLYIACFQYIWIGCREQ